MINFDNLINDINEETKVDDYLLNFFTKQNYKDYDVSELADANQVKAIKIMFESKKSIRERIEEAFEIDPFCLEALFAYLMTSEDVFLQLRFDAYFDELDNYPSFNEYQKKCYIKILDFYVEFLLDINNVTKAINVQKMLVKLTNNFTSTAISRLAYCYYALEDADGFYRLFAEDKFGLYEYLLCIVTLLKNDEQLKAQEVLLDMFDNVKYGTYLDHVWDLDESDPEQKKFADTVQDNYDDLKSIPTFFSWVNKTREKNGK